MRAAVAKSENLSDIGKPRTDLDLAIHAARRDVALGKLDAFADQAHKLGALVRDNAVPLAQVVDALHDIAVANSLIEIHGDECIHDVIAAALIGGGA